MVNKSKYLDYFSKMLLIRYFEEKLDWMFSRDLLPGTAHLCIGQEAVAVGAIAALEPSDLVVSTHRGHGHVLAKGADPKKLLSEIMGKEPGYCKGIGGSQHVCASDIFFMGTNGITGGGIPLATGMALASKLKNENRVVICFFGDGAANQGTFHESLNMAALWKVPVIFVCENNFYAMSTPIEESMPIKDVATRASSYNMPGEIVDGQNILKVKEVVLKAVERARMQLGPTLIEAKTYRYHGHSKSDARKYRTREEEAFWKQKDPIQKFEEVLCKEGIDVSVVQGIKDKINNQMEEAFNFSMAAQYADRSVLCIDENL